LKASQHLLDLADVFPELSCFHAQQCVEKALKALLLQLHVEFPRTHDLARLLDLLKTARIDLPAEVDEAFALTQYAVQTRYPGIWEPVTRQEAREAALIAAQVLEWVERQLDAKA